MVDPLDPLKKDLARIGKVVKEVVKPVTTVCPLCGAVIEIPQFDSITRTGALMEHLGGSRCRMTKPWF